jgi:UDP-glucose 4-epimerase
VRLLVTGGAGFIGSNLCGLAVSDPAVSSVVVLDDLSTGTRANLAGVEVEFVEGSILDDDALDSVCAGVDAVVHLAAVPSVPRSIVDPMTSHAANATGTLRVLEAARRHTIGHVIVASSSSVYGGNPVLPKDEQAWTRPLSPYAASKLAAEAYALAYQTSYGVPVLAFRFFNVYGPGQDADHAYAAVVPRFIDAALRGRPVEIYGDGRQSRDFTYVGSVCEVLLDAARRRVRSESPVNLAFGARTTLLELVSTLERVLDRLIVVRRRPPRLGDVLHSQSDGTVLTEMFPDAVATPLPEGLRRTADWFLGAAPIPATVATARPVAQRAP